LEEIALKKEWQKPQLIVMTRSKPEESVLTYCKGGEITGAGGSGCYYGGYGSDVGYCDAWLIS